MNWIALTSEDDFNKALEQSQQFVIGIFKHSTRCSISAVAKKRMELKFNSLPENSKLFYLDLLNYRSLSNRISEVLNVEHQSPQLIVIKEKEVLSTSSHLGVSISQILKHS